MRNLITGATLVNEGRAIKASLVVEDDHIAEIIPCGETPRDNCQQTTDATGCLLLPGIIDTHVHFRDPGLTHKADMESESRAAAAGGVTTIFDMPNTKPQTTTLEALEEKFAIAREKCHVNCSFFFGATNDNTHLFSQLDRQRIPGIKLFMGSSTGNMLVDKEESLNRVFHEAQMPIVAHCEDTDIINRNMAAAKEQFGGEPPVTMHPLIRSREACVASTRKAIELAIRNHARLHVAHISTAEELELIRAAQDKGITAEATVPHLLFCDEDYNSLGTAIKCNPAVKTAADREALRHALTDGTITTIATDHAPHLWSEKQGGAASAMSGMPMVQFSLVSMLGLVDEGVMTIERLVELMCHNPARLFNIDQRGFLRPGYKADLVLVRPNSPWTLTPDLILSKCGWSPLTGRTFNWRVEQVWINGIAAPKPPKGGCTLPHPSPHGTYPITFHH